MLRIVKYPHPALRYASRPVGQIDDELRAVVREMFDLMYEARGVGLAANQVALPFRFFILNVTADPDEKDQELVFINPEIVKRHASAEDEEGCLSIPGIWEEVPRAAGVTLQYQDENFVFHTRIFSGDTARAIQHEYDHLNGKLYLDHLPPLRRALLKNKLQAIAKGKIKAPYPVKRITN